jgi:hypothetical protein
LRNACELACFGAGDSDGPRQRSSRDQALLLGGGQPAFRRRCRGSLGLAPGSSLAADGSALRSGTGSALIGGKQENRVAGRARQRPACDAEEPPSTPR